MFGLVSKLCLDGVESKRKVETLRGRLVPGGGQSRRMVALIGLNTLRTV